MKKNSSLAETIKTHDILAKLLFEWPIKTAPRIALPLFIVFAALLHLSTVYFFNIVYEPPHVSKSIAAQVFFLVPNSPASQQLAPWLQANDPAIFSPLKTVRTNQPKIPASIYQLNQPPPILHPLPPHEAGKMQSLLPPIDELVLPSMPLSTWDGASIETTPSSSPINKTTTIRLLENSAERAPTPLSTLGHPSLPSGINTPLHPTILTVNIDPSGIPHHVLMTQSSGNEAADESAIHWLITRHFVPAAKETWGRVLIFWGTE
ncbi:MAG: hypothetical protein ACOYK6_01825 [Chthoniobacterales bacterium]